MAAALALGAQGVWTGSMWLTVTESASPPEMMNDLLAASSSDTVRSKCMSGKPIRQLRSEWTDVWSRPDAPKPLPAPLQTMLCAEELPPHSILYGVHEGAQGGVPYRANAGLPIVRPVVGQVVGRLNEVRPTRAVMESLVEECIEAVATLSSLFEIAE
jgi:NAD(P)H-dependent flavin oxidoreductase YrpB (nitropropane dioxygenase family)